MSPSSKTPCLGLLAEHSNCSFASGFLCFFWVGGGLLDTNPIIAFLKQIQLDDVRASSWWLWDMSYKICLMVSQSKHCPSRHSLYHEITSTLLTFRKIVPQALGGQLRLRTLLVILLPCWVPILYFIFIYCIYFVLYIVCSVWELTIFF